METTVFNIINALQQFHSDLADYFFEQKNNTSDTRVIALLDYMGRSERYLENHIDRHRLGLSRETLGKTITIPATVDSRTILNLDDRQLPPVLDNYGKTMTFAIRTDVMLISYCRHLKESTDDPVLKSIFRDLCKATRREKRNLFSYNNLFSD